MVLVSTPGRAEGDFLLKGKGSVVEAAFVCVCVDFEMPLQGVLLKPQARVSAKSL